MKNKLIIYVLLLLISQVSFLKAQVQYFPQQQINQSLAKAHIDGVSRKQTASANSLTINKMHLNAFKQWKS